MPIVVFLSTVSDEFGDYRVKLEGDLTRHDVAVKVQERFKDLGGDTLEKLDAYITACDGVVHLIGDMCGAAADEGQQQALIAKNSNLPERLPPLGEALKNGVCLPYTQWEAWLSLYHGKPLLIAKAKSAAPRGPRYKPTDASRATQANHLKRLKAFHRYPGSEFGSPDELAKQIAYTAILDLLVEDYAKKFAQQRDVAEGFIREMAKRVAGDAALDLDGMKQAVQNAVEIYEKEIAGRPVETNLAEIVGRALSRAKEQVDKGQSGLARATLRRAAEEMRRDEEERRRDEKERRERYVAGTTKVRNNERDISLATHDGSGAAEAMIALADDIHGSNATKGAEFLKGEADALYQYGDERGSNVHLAATISLQRELLRRAGTADEQGAARNALGNALYRLGERESGTARLEEAAAAYRAAFDEYTRERVPRQWAATQNNLGNALLRLGERESGTARLEEAVAAYHEVLKEITRVRAPLEWAMAQGNLGNALQLLSERENSTARLEEAVAAYRAALEVFNCARKQFPVDWVRAQNNLGRALQRLGTGESSTARLEEALAAYRAALEGWTRERVPLEWATMQNNLGTALRTLGERESGTARLEEAVHAFCAALEERKRERVPLDWAASFGECGVALMVIAEHANDANVADIAVRHIETAYEAAQLGGDAYLAAKLRSHLAEAEVIRDRLKAQ